VFNEGGGAAAMMPETMEGTASSSADDRSSHPPPMAPTGQSKPAAAAAAAARDSGGGGTLRTVAPSAGIKPAVKVSLDYSRFDHIGVPSSKPPSHQQTCAVFLGCSCSRLPLRSDATLRATCVRRGQQLGERERGRAGGGGRLCRVRGRRHATRCRCGCKQGAELGSHRRGLSRVLPGRSPKRRACKSIHPQNSIELRTPHQNHSRTLHPSPPGGVISLRHTAPCPFVHHIPPPLTALCRSSDSE
jgi:hypothetical protein